MSVRHGNSNQKIDAINYVKDHSALEGTQTACQRCKKVEGITSNIFFVMKIVLLPFLLYFMMIHFYVGRTLENSSFLENSPNFTFSFCNSRILRTKRKLKNEVVNTDRE